MKNTKININRERYPLSCQWEITCRCNLRCVMCYTDCFNTPEKIKNELYTTDFLRILNEMAAEGCLELVFTGGEPFSRPDFFEIYEHAKQRGFLITIFTNGTLITRDIADRLAGSPPTRVEISMHGLTKNVFESVTVGKGSFEKCMSAIDLLLERNLPVVLKSTMLTLNKDELLKIKAYARKKGLSYRMGEDIRRSLDGSSAPKHFELTNEEVNAVEKPDAELCIEACKRDTEVRRPCVTGTRSFHIDAYGMLQLCSSNRRNSYDLKKGSFREGFYDHLPSFACPHKINNLKQGEKSRTVILSPQGEGSQP